MAYTDDLQSLHNPATSTAPPALWGDAVRDNFLCVERVIHHQVIGSAASSISSGTLPTVTNGWALRIFIRAQNSAGTARDIGLRFNGDSGSNYVRQYVLGNDTTVSGDAVAATTSFLVGTMGNESASRWSATEVRVLDYLGSGHKQILSQSFDPRNLTAALWINVGGNWASTSAITSVSVHASADNFVAGSSLTVLATPSI